MQALTIAGSLRPAVQEFAGAVLSREKLACSPAQSLCPAHSLCALQTNMALEYQWTGSQPSSDFALALHVVKDEGSHALQAMLLRQPAIN